jgi:hypothetical protein
MLHVSREAGALSADPRQKRGAQESSGNRGAFSLITSFSTVWMQSTNSRRFSRRRSSCRGEAKESNSPSGREPDSNNRRVSDTLNLRSQDSANCVTSVIKIKMFLMAAD